MKLLNPLQNIDSNTTCSQYCTTLERNAESSQWLVLAMVSPMANGVLLFSSSVIEFGGWVIFVLQVAAMYKNQKNSGQVSGSAPDPEDFY